MKIWLHLRTNFSNNININNNIINIILINFSSSKEKFFNVYLDEKTNITREYENIDIYRIEYKATSIKNQINFRKILTEHNNDLNIFFDSARPILYKGEDIFVINNLNNLLYETSEVDSFAKKYKYHFFLEHSSLYSKKIVTFLDNINHSLNEKVNIDEEKINTIYPFFHKKDFSEYDDKLDILQENKFVIYNSGSWKENIKIFFEAIFNYNSENTEKLDIIFIWEEYNDVEIRKLALQYELIWNIKNIENNDEKTYVYYKNASFIIYPTFYDVFPFELNDAMNIGTPILALNTESIKEIFWDSLNYFKPNSLIDLEENIKKMLEKNSKYNYSKVFEKYSVENFINNLEKVFPEVKEETKIKNEIKETKKEELKEKNEQKELKK